MLSQDIRNLRAAMEAALADGRFTLSTMVLTLQRLDALADQAAAMEGTVVPFPARAGDADLPANVVRIARKLDRAGVRVGLPEGGAA